jgi:hypothetical protein
VSAPAALRRGAGARLLGLYPEPWRARYRAEMLALLEDDPPGARGLASLITGAARAHLRPAASAPLSASPAARMRLSLGGAFACWIALSLMGLGFQKVTEDGAFTAAAARHPLLSLAHGAIIAGAILGAAAIAVGGLPLLWAALARAVASRDRRLGSLLALPAGAVLCLALLTRLLAAAAPARDNGFPAGFVLSAGLPWVLLSIACAAVCALTPRLVMRRIAPSRRLLRCASFAALPLLAAMCLVTVGLSAYAVALYADAPAAAAAASGPLGESSGAMLLGHSLVSLLSTAVAALCAARAYRAARSPAAAR